jgi:hypothetical protein
MACAMRWTRASLEGRGKEIGRQFELLLSGPEEDESDWPPDWQSQEFPPYPGSMELPESTVGPRSTLLPTSVNAAALSLVALLW